MNARRVGRAQGGRHRIVGAQPVAILPPTHVSPWPRRIRGEFGTADFDKSVAACLEEVDLVELHFSELDLTHGDTIEVLQALVMSRKWKSITIQACRLTNDDNDDDSDASEDNGNASGSGTETDANTNASAGLNASAAPSQASNAASSGDAAGSDAHDTTMADTHDGGTTERAPTSASAQSEGRAARAAPAAGTTDASSTNPQPASTTRRRRRRQRPRPNNPLLMAVLCQTRRLLIQDQEELPDVVARLLGKMLQSTRCWIHTLSFHTAGFSLAAAQSMGVGIRGSSRLRALGLTKVYFTPETLSALLLPATISPTTVVSNSSLTADAASMEGTPNAKRSHLPMGAAGRSTSLRGLFFRDCLFDISHIKVISKSLEYHYMLHQFWLNGEQDFGPDGADLLVSTIEQHFELEHVDLPRYIMSPATSERLRQSLELNRGGRRLLRRSPNEESLLCLWPTVLERAFRIRGLSDVSRASIVYMLVKEVLGTSQSGADERKTER